MHATGSGSWVAQASVLGGGVVRRRPSWDAGAGGSGRLKGFGVVRCCVQEKKPRVRKTKEERREMVESFVNTYRVSNDGKFPSVNLTHKEVGGSYYIVREIVRDIIQENRVLGPGGLNATALSFEDCPDSVQSPVTHELGQDSVEILDMSDDDHVGKDTVMDMEELWSSQNTVMSTQQLLGSSNLLDAGILNGAVQNGNVADTTCLETNHEKQDEVPRGQSTEIDPSRPEKQAPSFSHAPDSESEFEMDSWVDAHETTSSLTNGVVSSGPSAVITNKSLLQDHDDTTDSTVDEAVLCLQTNGSSQANETILQEHETRPESVMSNDVQNVDGQSNSTMDTFNSNTSYAEKEDTTKSIEVSEVQRLHTDEEEKTENLVSHAELDTKVLSHIEGKNGMVEEDNSELKQSISVITKEEHDGKPELGGSTTTAISRHALCLLTLRCMLTVYNFLHASQKDTAYLNSLVQHRNLVSSSPAMAASSLLRSLSRLSRRGCGGGAGPSPFHHSRLPYSPFSTAAADAVESGFAGLGPTAKGEKARVVVLGTGWAGSRLMKDLDTTGYEVVCVSPRNHMVFTPLLASTCVGTLEFRSVAEPLARIQPAVSKSPGSYFLLARCTAVDPDAHMIDCETVTEKDALKPWKFKVAYDKLVFACGAEASTFGIRGVTDHAIFLREVHHAQEIRRKLLLNLMLSDVPGISEEEKHRLLHCVVVGGGPTGVEFSGELSDFIIRDVKQRYSHVKNYIHVTLIEANEILSSFDVRLRQYATNQLTKSGVRLVRGIVKDVQPNKLILDNGEEVPYGLLVWSTGVGASSFVKSLPFPKSPGGRIGVDEWLRVPSARDVFAIGDCSGFLESTGKDVLPALAQVAERQGKYLAHLLNHVMKAGGGHANCEIDVDLGPAFVYKHLGSMATVGRYKALVDLRQSKESKGISLAGFVSWFIWRSAYLTRVVSWRNRFYVAINWLTTLLFGRDISRI